MLRFVQGIHKAFRSNQAYAPCQKATHDSEEYETRAIDCIGSKRTLSTVSLDIPLSQPLPSCVISDVSPAPLASGYGTGRNEKGSNGYTVPPGLIPGAIFGAGYAVFNTIHAYCSGKQGTSKKDKSKFCPVTQYQHLQRTNVVFRSLTHLLSSNHDVSPAFKGILPKKACSIAQRQAVEKSLDCSSGIDNDEKLRLQEFEKAKHQVTSLADQLCSIDKENLAADHFLAMEAWKRRDFGSAAELWQRTVDKFATPMAANRLGICYEHGQGVTQDYQQASDYYNLAISHGCARAMFNQAMLQMKGLVRAKTEDSMKLIKQAADLNLSMAQTYLGSYHFHNGNTKTAVKFYEKAALNNDVEACYYLGICYETGTGVVYQDDCKAAELYTRAAEGGHASAQYNLAVFYEEGYGNLEPDHEKAIHWYTKSSRQGHQQAKERLQQLGRWNLTPSVSLPAIGRHLPTTLSDLSIQELMRTHSDNVLPHRKQQAPVLDVTQALSRASSSSSVAGTPKFFIPSVDEDEDLSSFGEWTDEEVSTSGSASSLYRPNNSTDKFSVDFSVTSMSYSNNDENPLMAQKQQHYDWLSCSQTSLYKPEHEGLQVVFA